MKFGVLVNNHNKNIGDDIQSYAVSRFLPSIDYLVDRETIDTFETKSGEPVAVVMSAWWMRRKWNFPPSKYIYPKLISMHLTNFNVRKRASPIFDELFDGIGGEYMKAYGPVGARDMNTLKVLQNHGIDSYFSGCSTLTLPKQKIIKPKKEYICLVDLDPDVEKKMLKILKGKDIEVKIIKHNLVQSRSKEKSEWEYRKQEVIDLLTIYQNAKCVVTRRLHASLPCLAMEVPVFCIFYKTNIRFSPYVDWLNMVSPDEFLKDKYDYDFLNPKPNPNTYKKTREELIKTITEFVEEAKEIDKPVDELVRTTYTEEEKKMWQYDLMKDTLNKWLPESVDMVNEIEKLQKEISILKKHQSSSFSIYKKARSLGGKVLRKLKKTKSNKSKK